MIVYLITHWLNPQGYFLQGAWPSSALEVSLKGLYQAQVELKLIKMEALVAVA